MEEWYATESVSGQTEREDVGYFIVEDGSDVVGYATGGPGEGEDTAVLGAIYSPVGWSTNVVSSPQSAARSPSAHTPNVSVA